MDANNPRTTQFYRLIETARPPQRADRSACGTLPMRAVRYCEAVTSATAFGWWAFAPMDLQLLWDGHEIFWNHSDADDWMPLLPSACHPSIDSAFARNAPADMADCAPPMLTALPEPGAIQIWTGLFVRTLPDVHVLVRSPVNLPSGGGYSVFEGIIETDQWFGPLFANLRLTRTHSPIRLRADYPLVQVQPLPAQAYSDAVLDDFTTAGGVEAFSALEWEDYRSTIVTPNDNPDRAFGAYAVRARKRRARGCPIEVI